MNISRQRNDGNLFSSPPQLSKTPRQEDSDEEEEHLSNVKVNVNRHGSIVIDRGNIYNNTDNYNNTNTNNNNNNNNFQSSNSSSSPTLATTPIQDQDDYNMHAKDEFYSDSPLNIPPLSPISKKKRRLTLVSQTKKKEIKEINESKDMKLNASKEMQLHNSMEAKQNKDAMTYTFDRGSWNPFEDLDQSDVVGTTEDTALQGLILLPVGGGEEEKKEQEKNSSSVMDELEAATEDW